MKILSGFEEASEFARSEGRVLLLMQGAPGSGKTTLAQKLEAAFPRSWTVSADDYYMGLSTANTAHAKALSDARFALSRAQVVIVDNTNTRACDRAPYELLAEQYRIAAAAVRPGTPWEWDAHECAARTHRTGTTAAYAQRGIDAIRSGE
jgi:predicted kinase